MSAGDSYALEPDELRAVIAEMRRCRAGLELTLADLRRNVRALHETWDGLAAQAQQAAQAELERGIATMNQALADLIDASDRAEQNYGAAVAANLAMWQVVS